MTDIVWKTVTLPDAVVGAPYEAGLAFTGNATAITACVVKAASGALPTGIVINADLVRLTGTPKAVAGSYSFKLTLTDTAGAVDSGTFTLRVRDTFDMTPGDTNVDTLASQLGREWPLQL